MADLSAAAYAIPLRAVVTTSHKPRDNLELELKKGQRLLLLEQKGDWWYIAFHPKSKKQGWVPAKHLRILPQLDDYTLGKLFLNWYEKKERAFGGEKKSGMESITEESVRREMLCKETFPFLPLGIDVCDKVVCKMRKMEKGLGVCVHDVEAFLKAGVGELYGSKFLWVESLQWHPDRAGRKCKVDFMVEGKKVASEMYVILQELTAQARKKEGGE